MVFFCVKQKTAYEMRIRDWSADVCSSDLVKVDEDRRVFLPGGAELKSRGKRPDGRGAARLIVRPESLRVLAQGETADNELVAHVDLVVLTGEDRKSVV